MFNARLPPGWGEEETTSLSQHGGGGSRTQEVMEETSEDVLRFLAPEWSESPEAAKKLVAERIKTPLDVARLDKHDLKELGLGMAERARVLHWSSKTVTQPVGVRRQTSDLGLSPPDATPTTSLALARSWADASARNTRSAIEERRLDEIEGQADFWCSCFTRSEKHLLPDCLQDDVRENILEAFFDCTPERVREVFSGMDADSDGRVFTVVELHDGLERCGITSLEHVTLSKVFERVTGDGKMLNLQAFESILCRLRLARLLVKPLQANLSVVDYTYSKAVVKHVDEDSMREFFFGHRPDTKADENPVRWVHMQNFNLTLLLALTVKYCLHPLSVEDVIEQCPTKIDRFGQNFFVAIELLTIVEDGKDGRQPVRVCGHHVTAFCSGPPSLDTLLTFVQSERNFCEDWPGGLSSTAPPTVRRRAWPEKLQQRLLAARSRLRERRADFLLYTVVDLCADEIVAVTRAYLVRLAWLEEDLRTHGDRSLIDLGEVSLVKLQLAVLGRRLRSLQRVVRRASDYRDLHSTGSADYWKDCADHLEEAHDDAWHLTQRCDALQMAHEQVMEKGHGEQLRRQNELNQLQAEKVNNMLFFLTMSTALCTPLQFMSSVYGMNFVSQDGIPTIPFLLDKDGYRRFWIGVYVYIVVALVCAFVLYHRIHRPCCRANEKRLPACGGKWENPAVECPVDGSSGV
mmetsp:Transcript_46463/g.83882  ORF Transcript_46463/g.83882 Transcript_46463/m.83882 type:complete len:690 (-) Transcript_46463:241-2310(-)